MILHHLTVETGHTASTSRRDVTDDVVMRLQHIVDSQGGLIAEAGIYVDVIRPLKPGDRPIDGAAAFTLQLGEGGVALAANAVCWIEGMSGDAWRIIGEPATAIVTGRPIKRPPSPWLATKILPGVADVPRDVIGMLGDLERCLAWTIIETPI